MHDTVCLVICMVADFCRTCLHMVRFGALMCGDKVVHHITGRVPDYQVVGAVEMKVAMQRAGWGCRNLFVPTKAKSRAAFQKADKLSRKHTNFVFVANIDGHWVSWRRERTGLVYFDPDEPGISFLQDSRQIQGELRCLFVFSQIQLTPLQQSPNLSRLHPGKFQGYGKKRNVETDAYTDADVVDVADDTDSDFEPAPKVDVDDDTDSDFEPAPKKPNRKKKDARIAQLETENAQLKTDNAQLETKNAQLETDNAQLQTEKKRYETKNAELNNIITMRGIQHLKEIKNFEEREMMQALCTGRRILWKSSSTVNKGRCEHGHSEMAKITCILNKLTCSSESCRSGINANPNSPRKLYTTTAYYTKEESVTLTMERMRACEQSYKKHDQKAFDDAGYDSMSYDHKVLFLLRFFAEYCSGKDIYTRITTGDTSEAQQAREFLFDVNAGTIRMFHGNKIQNTTGIVSVSGSGICDRNPKGVLVGIKNPTNEGNGCVFGEGVYLTMDMCKALAYGFADGRINGDSVSNVLLIDVAAVPLDEILVLETDLQVRQLYGANQCLMHMVHAGKTMGFDATTLMGHHEAVMNTTQQNTMWTFMRNYDLKALFTVSGVLTVCIANEHYAPTYRWHHLSELEECMDRQGLYFDSTKRE